MSRQELIEALKAQTLLGAAVDTGPAGPAGADGERGPQGATGSKGDTGAAGSKGDRGAKGDKGDPGRDSTSPDERVSLDGTDRAGYLLDKLRAGAGISFTRRAGQLFIHAFGGSGGGGGLLAGAPAGATGPTGATGPAGPAGPAGADAPSTLDVQLNGWDGTQWIPVLGDSTGRLVVTS